MKGVGNYETLLPEKVMVGRTYSFTFVLHDP